MEGCVDNFGKYIKMTSRSGHNQESFESGESAKPSGGRSDFSVQLKWITTEPIHECKQESSLHMYSKGRASAGGWPSTLSLGLYACPDATFPLLHHHISLILSYMESKEEMSIFEYSINLRT